MHGRDRLRLLRVGFVEETAHDATTPVEASLDDPNRPAPHLPHLSRLHVDPERVILCQVQTLAERCAAQFQPSGFEEDFLVLSESLLLLYDKVRAQLSRVPALKPSTRQELFRRLVARAARLSRYHFHSTFTRVFQRTPHAYLTEVRLARTHSMLRSDCPVTQVCLAAGFTSPSSFSRLFRGATVCLPPLFVNKKFARLDQPDRADLTHIRLMKLAVLVRSTLAIAGAQAIEPRPNLPSRVSMIMLGVENIARSVEFYGDTLALELRNQSRRVALPWG